MAKRRRRERNYEVSRILDRRLNDQGQTEYLIKWKGAHYQDDWILQDDLCCPDLLAEFERNLGLIPMSPAFSEEDADISNAENNTSTTSNSSSNNDNNSNVSKRPRTPKKVVSNGDMPQEEKSDEQANSPKKFMIFESIFSNDKTACLNHFKIRDVSGKEPARIITEQEAIESYREEYKNYLVNHRKQVDEMLTKIR